MDVTLMEDEQDDLQKTRLKKVQEKNKRAQARYRQKQKEKMSGFEAECHQLTEQLKELQRAYEKLQGDNAALELSLRETRSMPSGREEPVEQARAAASPSPEENPNRPVRPTPKGWARFANSSSETFYHDFVRNIVSKYLGEDSAKEADVHPFQYQSPSQIAALYKGFIEELRARLVQADQEQSTKSQRAVMDVIHAMRTMGRTYQENLTNQQRLEGGAGLREEIIDAYGVPAAHHWHNVLSAARVSTGQRDRILKLRQAHLLKIEGIVRKRKDIVWELQQATVMPESASSRQTAFSKTIKSSQQLQDNLLEEHFAKEDFFRTVCHQVLNELQEARMIITATPYVLDVAAICDLLAAEPEKMSQPTTEAHEPFGSHVLPAILQIPAVVDSDLTPDQYLTAFAWGYDRSNGLRNRFMGGNFPGLQPFGSLPPGQGRGQLNGLVGGGNVNMFAGGGHGSGFAPPRQLNGGGRSTPPSR